ncbi:ORF26 [Xestia c-nigrum granulovirus]|uniref:ORF26 n=1 Tax=Xestia c-nigrum granulosis virus TaxID=51677 RepID=Q9PZ17_GVXN|nr:ORF26 [Xestia c-nigrum granulovirus]AAF05140.1 ORF26 [Xestia c-nigrum granulovirus]
MTTVPSLLNSIAQIREVDHDLDDYVPVAESVTQQQSLSVLEEIQILENTLPENMLTEENTEELFKKHDQQQHNIAEETPVEDTKLMEGESENIPQMIEEKPKPVEDTKPAIMEEKPVVETKPEEEAKPKKRVRFTEAEDDVVCKKIKQEMQDYEEEELVPEENNELFECNVSVHSDSEDEEMRSDDPQRSKSFTMEVLVDCLTRTEEFLMENKVEQARANIDYLLNKCQNRTSVRKRLEGRRSKKNLQGYVHVFCAKRAIGFYSNSYEKPKSIPQMVHFITIKSAVKNDKTDKTSSVNIVRDLKKAAGGYVYRANDTPKKHMNVFKHKLEKCIKSMYKYVQDNNLTVVSNDSEWRTKLNELPDVQSEASE